jgi:hypothetical protein
MGHHSLQNASRGGYTTVHLSGRVEKCPGPAGNDTSDTLNCRDDNTTSEVNVYGFAILKSECSPEVTGRDPSFGVSSSQPWQFKPSAPYLCTRPRHHSLPQFPRQQRYRHRPAPLGSFTLQCPYPQVVARSLQIDLADFGFATRPSGDPWTPQSRHLLPGITRTVPFRLDFSGSRNLPLSGALSSSIRGCYLARLPPDVRSVLHLICPHIFNWLNRLVGFPVRVVIPSSYLHDPPCPQITRSVPSQKMSLRCSMMSRGRKEFGEPITIYSQG